MTFSFAMVQVGLLVVLVGVTCGLIRLHVIALRGIGAGDIAHEADSPSPTAAQDLAIRLWRILPAVPLLYAAMSLWQEGLPGGVWYDIALSMLAWLLCWWAGRTVVRESFDPALPLAILALLGLHVGLLIEVSRAWLVDGRPNPGWLTSTAFLLVGGTVLPGAILRSRRKDKRFTPSWYFALSGRAGVQVGLVVFTGGACLSVLQLISHKPLPVYACAFAAVLLAGTTAMARCAGTPYHHGTAVGYLNRWWPALVLSGIDVVLPLGTKDFSPAVVILCTITSVLALIRERTMALVLAALMALGLLGISQSSLVPRFQERWTLMERPFEGHSSQMAQTLYAVARGGIFGVGPGRLAEIQSRYRGNVVLRPAIQLAESDAVLTTIAESTGAVGIGSVMALFALVTSGLLAAARRADRLWVRIYLTQAGVMFIVCAVWSTAWSVANVAPIAGLAVPMLTRGWGAMGFWLLAMCLALMVADMDEPTPTPVLPLENSKLWARPSAIAISLLIVTWLAVVRIDTVGREHVLSQVFHDTALEEQIAEWIVRGEVRCRGSSLVVYDPGYGDSREIKACISKELIRSSRKSNGSFIPVPVRENMEEVEPSGLGAALRNCQE